MSREDYLRTQHEQESNYDERRALARMKLDLANELHKRRVQLQLDLTEVSDETGISVDRLEMIEEGDVGSLTEVFRLALALQLAVILDGIWGVHVRPIPEPLNTQVSIPERFQPIARATASASRFRPVNTEESQTVSGLPSERDLVATA